MPPIAKITKDMILNTALSITRVTGFETVNARSIARELQCSTRPIFTCYKNMDEMKRDFLAFAYEYYNQYVADYCESTKVSPCLYHALSYIAFAQEETHLFQLLFVNDMDLQMMEAEDFYNEIDNVRRAEEFAEIIGVEANPARVIFLDLFLYTHGLAVLTATKKIRLERSSAQKMLENVLTALIRQEKPEWRIT